MTSPARRCACSFMPAVNPGNVASKTSKPWLNPYSGPRMKAPTNPAVRYRFALKSVARVVAPGGMGVEALSLTPKRAGYWPVRIAACAGPVSGACDVASANRTPSLANRSIAGVAAFAYPYAPT